MDKKISKIYKSLTIDRFPTAIKIKARIRKENQNSYKKSSTVTE